MDMKIEVQPKADIPGVIPCLRCGECCRKYQVRMDLAEGHRIADSLGLTWEEFRNSYADRRWPGEQSILLRQEPGGCPFLERCGEGTEARCSIHSFKPASCREWTANLDRPECQAGLAKRWGLIVNSRGELEGPDERIRDFRLYLDSLAGDRRSLYAHL